MLINHIHTSHNHIGLSQTLSLHRQHCWTPKIRSRIKSLLFRWVVCQRIKSDTIKRPPPPPLPAERVKWVPLFTNVGVDHTGSFTIKNEKGNKTKAYICIFICATTHAVHLEVVGNLSTTSFIMCLQCLAASKEVPSIILSDNHCTFIAGETFLLEMQQDPAVQEHLSSNNIRWKYQTPRSLWMGGHFERLVQTIKASLATAISKKLLTFEEFTAIVKEAENIVNSRPLTYRSDNSRDIPLTPSQLAWGRDLTPMPPLLQPGDPLDENYDVKANRALYIVLSNALECFRKRWHNEYLISLREKYYNQCAENPSHHLRVGQLVMVKHDNIHRIKWPLGVITAVYPGERGVIRTAEVEECGRRLIRSITFIFPLELNCHWEDDVIRQRLCDDQRGGDDDNVYSRVDSTSEAGGLGSPTTTAVAKERSIFYDLSLLESTSHRMPGSSQDSCSTTGTIPQCNITTEGDTGPPYMPSYHSHQPQQLSCNILRVRGVKRGGGAVILVKAATTSCSSSTGTPAESHRRRSNLDLSSSRVHA